MLLAWQKKKKERKRIAEESKSNVMNERRKTRITETDNMYYNFIIWNISIESYYCMQFICHCDRNVKLMFDDVWCMILFNVTMFSMNKQFALFDDVTFRFWSQSYPSCFVSLGLICFHTRSPPNHCMLSISVRLWRSDSDVALLLMKWRRRRLIMIT